ncbi:MAG: hypothetical protein ACI8R9_002598, partial [Paraglaciecola sp.]
KSRIWTGSQSKAQYTGNGIPFSSGVTQHRFCA